MTGRTVAHYAVQQKIGAGGMGVVCRAQDARREAVETAHMLETATQTGVLMGTFAYMAPEILQGKTADARSDLWALGVILYRALSGKLPFTALQRDPPPALPPSVPPALSTI